MARLEKGRTNYRIDKRYRGIGEIKKSSGISDRAMYKRMLVMLDELYTMPRWDILQDLQKGVTTPLEVYNWYKTQKLENISSAATIRTLNPHLFEWIESHDVAQIIGVAELELEAEAVQVHSNVASATYTNIGHRAGFVNS